MTNQHLRSLVLAAIVTLVPPSVGHAQVRSKSGKIIVLKPENLPEAARLAGDSFFLHSTPKGDYLYVEQQRGSQLTIFEVTDPANIKVKSTERLTVAGPFDFVRPLGNTAELVRFRDGKTAAVLNMSKEAAPELRDASTVKGTSQTIVLDESNLDISEPYKYVRAVPHDYEVVDTSSADKPEVVMIVKQVEHEVTKSNTGTTFLLSGNGLTVIRRMDAERDMKAHEQQLDSR